MILQILKHTPAWVFVLFVALLHLGYIQSKTRSVTKSRLAVLPLAMVGLSLYGVISAFGANVIGVASWTIAMALAVLVNTFLRQPQGVVYVSTAKAFVIPGSWLPLGLMMAIFFIKYAVAVALVRVPAPALRESVTFIALTALAYGFLSGIFFARTLYTWRSAQRVLSLS